MLKITAERKRTVAIPDNPNWNEVVLTNINVTNGQADIGIWNQANQDASIAFDDVEFFKQSPNYIQNPGFETDNGFT